MRQKAAPGAQKFDDGTWVTSPLKEYPYPLCHTISKAFCDAIHESRKAQAGGDQEAAQAVSDLEERLLSILPTLQSRSFDPYDSVSFQDIGHDCAAFNKH